MTSKFQYYPTDQLLIIYYQGIFDIEKFRQNLIKMMQDQKIPVKRILINLRDVKMGEKVKVFDQVLQNRKLIRVAEYKIAYLSNDPNVTANLHLYLSQVNNKNFMYFSTLLACIRHLNLNYTEQEIEAKIETLQRS